MTDPHIEGTAEEIGAEVVPHGSQQQSPGLFRTDDPVEVVEKATRVANALRDVLKQKGLTKRIQGREHVLVEGWTTLGAMVGVFPVVTWTRPTEHGWEARVEARTQYGMVIGAAEAEVSRKESSWSKRDDYALRSMAQTRATSKALRGPLGFIVTLAGYVATPAEEMPSERRDFEQTGSSDVPAVKSRITGAFKRAGGDAEAARVAMEAMDELGVPPAESMNARVKGLSAQHADVVVDVLTQFARVRKAAA